jgi:hypothetical protein
VQVFAGFAVFSQGLVRSADPTRPDVDQSSGPFAAQLALARVHPALAPQRRTSAGYSLDGALGEHWFLLKPGRGFASYGLARALRMLLDVLAGLTALHDTQAESGAGFVHGEVAPAMIRVDAHGIARLLPIAPWHWQSAGVQIFPDNLGHLAPERLLGDAIDCRADVFSAGVLLWEALAGRRLFEREPVEAIITRLMGGKVLLPELPPELAWAIPLKAVALRALSVDPEQRYADCPALAAAIEAIARGHVASHAMVAAHFAAPPKRASSLPPPLRRTLSLEEGFRASHKSSLSALVAPAIPAAASPSELPRASRGRGRRAAWTMTALVCLLVALGSVALTQRAPIGRAVQAAQSGRAAPIPAEPSAASAPAALSAPATDGVGAPPIASNAPPSSVAAEASNAARDPAHSGRAPLAPSPGKTRSAQPKVARPAGTKLVNTGDKAAEKYGI